LSNLLAVTAEINSFGRYRPLYSHYDGTTPGPLLYSHYDGTTPGPLLYSHYDGTTPGPLLYSHYDGTTPGPLLSQSLEIFFPIWALGYPI